MTVQAILAHKGSDVVTTEPTATLGDAVHLLNTRRIGALVVTGADRRIVGIISERDIVRAVAENGTAALQGSISEAMTRKVVTCTMGDTVAELMERMTTGKFRHVPVVEQGKLAGIISIGDVVKARLHEMEQESDALRASCALPGIFPPSRIGGRWLMDGALVNPLPISAARALGARMVIGVNLNADNFGRGTIIQDHGPDEEDDLRRAALKSKRGLRGRAERLLTRQFFGAAGRPGLSTVMIDAFQVVQDRITRARLAGDPPDVLISPRLARINLFDFHRAVESIAIGAEATEKALPSITEAIETLA